MKNTPMTPVSRVVKTPPAVKPVSSSHKRVADMAHEEATTEKARNQDDRS